MKIKNDELTELLNYPASKEQRLLILKEVKETGKSIGEIADKYAMPPMFVPDEDGTFEYKGERMNSEQFKQRFPHRRFVTISRKKGNNENIS